jgi:hypothetical protein
MDIQKIIVDVLQDIRNIVMNNDEYYLDITDYLLNKDHNDILIIKTRLETRGFIVRDSICNNKIKYFIKWNY